MPELARFALLIGVAVILTAGIVWWCARHSLRDYSDV